MLGSTTEHEEALARLDIIPSRLLSLAVTFPVLSRQFWEAFGRISHFLRPLSTVQAGVLTASRGAKLDHMPAVGVGSESVTDFRKVQIRVVRFGTASVAGCWAVEKFVGPLGCVAGGAEVY